MALFNTHKQPESNKPPQPEPSITPYRDIAVDSRVTSKKFLLTHVGGSKWVVNYYRQVLNADNETAPLDKDRPAAFQQYVLINDMELRVDDPLTQSQDSTSREFSYTGSAVVSAGVIPNVGDMFLADIGDGRDGIFTLTEVEQLTVLRDSAYQISYQLTDFANAQLVADLKRKTIKETWYVVDFLAYGNNPLLVESEYEDYQKILKWRHEIPQEYYGEFFSEEYNTILIPDQDGVTYDPFLTKFVKEVASQHTCYAAYRTQILNCSTSESRTATTLFDAILTRNERGLDFAENDMGRLVVKSNFYQPQFNTIRFSGIEFLVWPKGMAGLGVKSMLEIKPSEEPKFRRKVDLEKYITVDKLCGLNLPQSKAIPLIKPVNSDGFYVLSDAFYNQDAFNMSILESEITEFMLGRPNDIKRLSKLVNASIYWGKVERYYYIPLLILLLNDIMKDIN